MKKLLSIFFILLLNTSVYAQIVTAGTNSDRFQTIVNGTLSVVLTEDDAYNKAIIDAVKDHWKVSKYAFITADEFDQTISDPSKAFLVLLTSEVTREYSSFTDTKIKTWMSIIAGGKKKFSKYTDNDVVVIAPTSLYGDEKDVKCAYRASYMVKGMNDAVEMVRDNNVKGGYMAMVKWSQNAYKSRASKLKQKTLIMNADLKTDIPAGGLQSSGPVYDKNAIKSGLKVKYKMVSDQEFREMVAEGGKEYAFVFPIIEVNKHLIIIDGGTKETLYYGWAMQGLKIKASDIKALNKSIYQ